MTRKGWPLTSMSAPRASSPGAKRVSRTLLPIMMTLARSCRSRSEKARPEAISWRLISRMALVTPSTRTPRRPSKARPARARRGWATSVSGEMTPAPGTIARRARASERVSPGDTAAKGAWRSFTPWGMPVIFSMPPCSLREFSQVPKKPSIKPVVTTMDATPSITQEMVSRERSLWPQISPRPLVTPESSRFMPGLPR